MGFCCLAEYDIMSANIPVVTHIADMQQYDIVWCKISLLTGHCDILVVYTLHDIGFMIACFHGSIKKNT